MGLMVLFIVSHLSVTGEWKARFLVWMNKYLYNFHLANNTKGLPLCQGFSTSPLWTFWAI